MKNWWTPWTVEQSSAATPVGWERERIQWRLALLFVIAAVVWVFILHVNLSVTMIEYHIKYLAYLIDGDISKALDFNALGDPRPRLINSILAFADIHLRSWALRHFAIHPSLSIVWIFYPLCLLLIYQVAFRLSAARRTAMISVVLYAASPALLDTINHHFLPAKPVMNFLFLLALYGGTLLFPPQSLRSSVRPRPVLGLTVLFTSATLALLTDETAIFIFLCLPLIFANFLTSAREQWSSKVSFGGALCGAVPIFLAVALLVIPAYNRSQNQVPLDFIGTIHNGAYAEMIGAEGLPLHGQLQRWSPIGLLETIIAVHAVPDRQAPGGWSYLKYYHFYEWRRRETLGFIGFILACAALTWQAVRSRWQIGLTLRLTAALLAFIIMESVIVLRNPDYPVETAYYAAFASVFFALILGLLLSNPGFGKVGTFFCRAAVAYLVLVQFTNYIGTAGRHPYNDQQRLTWTALRKVRAEVLNGDLAEVARKSPFPTRRFLYAFEVNAAMDPHRRGPVDLQPLQNVHLTAYRFFDDFLTRPGDLQVALPIDCAPKSASALMAQGAIRFEASEIASLLAGNDAYGSTGDWGFLRTFDRSGLVCQRVWRKGILRVWGGQGTWSLEPDGLRLCLANGDSELMHCLFRLDDTYWAFGPDGQHLATFKLRPSP